MNIQPAGADVSVLFPFKDLNGNAVTPTALSARVLDQDDEVVVAPYAVSFTPGSSSTTITVPGSANQVTGGASQARKIEVTVTTAQGSFKLESIYVLRPQDRLILLTNSFQTYAKALALSGDIAGITTFGALDDAMRQTALITAFERITRISFTVRRLEDFDHFYQIAPPYNDDTQYVTPAHWKQMTMPEWLNLPEAFRDALCKAQIIEADDLLQINSPAVKRRMGILSETVGESSMMFQSGKPSEAHGISVGAMGVLRNYIENKIVLRRT